MAIANPIPHSFGGIPIVFLKCSKASIQNGSRCSFARCTVTKTLPSGAPLAMPKDIRVYMGYHGFITFLPPKGLHEDSKRTIF